ncbi:MAG: hypothetical protein ACP5MB_07925 [bacterium]
MISLHSGITHFFKISYVPLSFTTVSIAADISISPLPSDIATSNTSFTSFINPKNAIGKFAHSFNPAIHLRYKDFLL